MTKLLEHAFQEASNLPDMQQNMIARRLLDELSSEKKWDSLFAESEDFLAGLAGKWRGNGGNGDRFILGKWGQIYFHPFYGILFPSNVTIAQGRMTSVTADTEQKPPEKESLRISINKPCPEPSLIQGFAFIISLPCLHTSGNILMWKS